jgi:hypothetical protein
LTQDVSTISPWISPTLSLSKNALTEWCADAAPEVIAARKKKLTLISLTVR